MRLRSLIPVALLAAALPCAGVARAQIDPANGQWSPLPAGGATPPALGGHAAALWTPRLAPTSLDMLVTGGPSVAPSTVWVLTLGDTPAWSSIVPGTGSVGDVTGATFVDQYPSDQFIRFGGTPFSPRVDGLYINANLGTPSNLTWASGTPQPQGVGFGGHAAVAPPSSFSMYVYGGYGQRNGQLPTNSFFLDDLWMIDGLGWHLLAPKGAHPSQREGHTMVYDGSRNRLLVFGGDTTAAGAPVVLGDTWAFSLADSTWSLLDGVGPPRTRHVAFYDPVRDRMVVHGGLNPAGALLGDAWALTLGGTPQWTPLAPDSVPPDPRFAAAGVYDPLRDRFAMFGGIATLDTTAETWFLSFGQTAQPQVTCSMPATALPGQRVRFTGIATSSLGAAQPHLVRLDLVGAGELAGRLDTLAAGALDTLTYTVAIPAAATNQVQLYAFTATAPRVPAQSPTCTCRLTITQLDAVPSFEATPAAVTLTWDVSGPGAPLPAVQRRLAGAATWDSIGVATLRGGLASFVDSTVAPNASLDYRLSFLIEGTPVVRGEVHVLVPDLPPPLALTLGGAWPNPTNGPLSVSFGLPDASPATLDVIDLAGRVVHSRDVSALGAGRHRLALPEVGRSGLYFVRLRQGATVRITRVCVIR